MVNRAAKPVSAAVSFPFKWKPNPLLASSAPHPLSPKLQTAADKPIDITQPADTYRAEKARRKAQLLARSSRPQLADRRRGKVYSKPRGVNKHRQLPTHEGVYEMRARMAAARKKEGAAANEGDDDVSAADTAAPSPPRRSAAPGAVSPATAKAVHTERQGSAKKKSSPMRQAASAAAGTPRKLAKRTVAISDKTKGPPSAPPLCLGRCGFFGTAEREGYCLQCYKRDVLGEATSPTLANVHSIERRAAVVARQRVEQALQERPIGDDDSVIHADGERVMPPKGVAAAVDGASSDSDGWAFDVDQGQDDGAALGEDDDELLESDASDGAVLSSAVTPMRKTGAPRRLRTEMGVESDVEEVAAPAITQGMKRLRVEMRDDGNPYLFRRRLERWRVFLAQRTANPAVSEFGEGALEVSLDAEAPNAMDEWFADDDYSLPSVEVRPGIFLPGFLGHR